MARPSPRELGRALFGLSAQKLEIHRGVAQRLGLDRAPLICRAMLADVPLTELFS
jgi:hypothetical protein